MKFLPLDTPEIIELAAGWLTQKENYQWLDLGNGRVTITPSLLKIMAQRGTNFLRVYTADRDDAPVGIVGLSNVDRAFKTATFWGASGEKSFRNRGYSTFAGAKLLTIAFGNLELNAVNTWVVDHNSSLRTIERLGFRFIGRQRQCHVIDGCLYDRLLFDLLASEYRGIDETQRRLIDRTRPEMAYE
ncbi:MAG: GNAT family N-acetyltransferase [Betaproteobacteria bacterium]|nr:GNAT family N-acetyltransferase [Betaproteobacteria bacterium]